MNDRFESGSQRRTDQLVHLPSELLRLLGHSVDRRLERVVHLQVLLLLGHLAKGLARRVACHSGSVVQVQDQWLGEHF